MRTQGAHFVPYKVGNRIHATVDIKCRLFERPLHFIFEIKRSFEEDGRQYFATSVVETVGDQFHLFEKGLAMLGDPHEMQS